MTTPIHATYLDGNKSAAGFYRSKGFVEVSRETGGEGIPESIWMQLDAAQDLSRESNAGASLVFTLKLKAAAAGSVQLALGCGPACAGRVALDKTLSELPTGKWVRVGVPLACFAKAGADLTRIDRVFGLSTATALDFSVSRVALETASDYPMDCTKP